MRVFDCNTLKNYHWDSEIQSTEASNKIEKSVTTSTRVQQLCMEKILQQTGMRKKLWDTVRC